MLDMLWMQQTGKIDSWAICWSYTHFKYHAVSICPVKSYINNIGLDGSGTHCEKTNQYYNDLSLSIASPKLSDFVYVDDRIMKSFQKIYQKNYIKILTKKMLNKLTK